MQYVAATGGGAMAAVRGVHDLARVAYVGQRFRCPRQHIFLSTP
jgi:hypothetical protein